MIGGQGKIYNQCTYIQIIKKIFLHKYKKTFLTTIKKIPANIKKNFLTFFPIFVFVLA